MTSPSTSTRVHRPSTSSTAPLQISVFNPVVILHDHRHAPPLKSNGISSILRYFSLAFRRSSSSSWSSIASSSRFFSPVW